MSSELTNALTHAIYVGIRLKAALLGKYAAEDWLEIQMMYETGETSRGGSLRMSESLQRECSAG
jgi:hypothetical protein